MVTMTGFFEFWVPDNELDIANTKWSPYIVPDECPDCGEPVEMCAGSAPGPYNALESPCHHMMPWSALRAVSTRKQTGPLVCVCVRCKLPNPFADPNLPDGGYLCYNCRN